MILTIEGDKLYPDGSSRSYPYIKYKPSNTPKSESLKGQQLKFVRKIKSYDVTTTETVTYDFPDDVSYKYTCIYEKYNHIINELEFRYVFSHNGNYVCTGDKIEFKSKGGTAGQEFKSTMGKSNGKWQIEGFVLQ